MVFYDRNGNPVNKPADKLVRLRSSSYGLYINDGKVLLNKPNWSEKYELPGGGVNKEETSIQGLKREFYEETGCTIIDLIEKPIKVVEQNYYADDFDEYFYSTQTFYLVKKINGTTKIIQPEEIDKIDYIPIEELNLSNCKQQTLDIIRSFRP